MGGYVFIEKWKQLPHLVANSDLVPRFIKLFSPTYLIINQKKRPKSFSDLYGLVGHSKEWKMILFQ